MGAANQIAYQHFRNVQFAQLIARCDSPTTRPYFVNLTRLGTENDTFEPFFKLVRPEHRRQVRHVFWEQLFPIAGLFGDRLNHLRNFMLGKTAGLRPAFNLGYL